MPEIRLCYRGARVTDPQLRGLKNLLKVRCAERFSISERVLEPDDFSFYGTNVGSGSGLNEQTHDVIVRVALHHDPERLDAAQTNAEELRDEAAALLNGHRERMEGPPVTVGVSLTLSEIAWAAT